MVISPDDFSSLNHHNTYNNNSESYHSNQMDHISRALTLNMNMNPLPLAYPSLPHPEHHHHHHHQGTLQHQQGSGHSLEETSGPIAASIFASPGNSFYSQLTPEAYYGVGLPVSSSGGAVHGMGHPNSTIESLRQFFHCTLPGARGETGEQCKVCGDYASGTHFGVLTCEGCKGFFKRNHLSPKDGGVVKGSVVAHKVGESLHCSRDKKCNINTNNRNSCRYCRYQKCLAVGMSRNAIKLGRRSKKDKVILRKDVEKQQRATQHRMSHPANRCTLPPYTTPFNPQDYLSTSLGYANPFSTSEVMFPTVGSSADQNATTMFNPLVENIHDGYSAKVQTSSLIQDNSHFFVPNIRQAETGNHHQQANALFVQSAQHMYENQPCSIEMRGHEKLAIQQQHANAVANSMDPNHLSHLADQSQNILQTLHANASYGIDTFPKHGCFPLNGTQSFGLETSIASNFVEQDGFGQMNGDTRKAEVLSGFCNMGDGVHIDESGNFVHKADGEIKEENSPFYNKSVNNSGMPENNSNFFICSDANKEESKVDIA